MEYYKTFKLLNDSTVSKFVTKTWVKVNDFSSSQYSVNKNIRFKTSILRSNLCDYCDAYIVVKRIISTTSTNANNRRNKKLLFQKSITDRQCRNLNIVMLMYNLLEYSDKYFMMSGSLWNYYRDKINDDENENNNNNNRLNNNKTIKVNL